MSAVVPGLYRFPGCRSQTSKSSHRSLACSRVGQPAASTPAARRETSIAWSHAMLARNQRVRVPCQEVQVRRDDRGFERLTRFASLAQGRQSLAEMTSRKPFAYWRAIKSRSAAMRHDIAKCERRIGAQILVGHFPHATRLREPNRPIDQSRIVDGGPSENGFDTLGKFDSVGERPPAEPATRRFPGSCWSKRPAGLPRSRRAQPSRLPVKLPSRAVPRSRPRSRESRRNAGRVGRRSRWTFPGFLAVTSSRQASLSQAPWRSGRCRDRIREMSSVSARS